MFIQKMMRKRRRITIMIDCDLDKKLRLILAKRVKKEQTSNNFSRILEEYLRKTLE